MSWLKRLVKVFGWDISSISKEDPIIAISILEKGNSDLYDDLDNECNQLLLELSVRKEIVNDTSFKVSNILEN